MNSQISENYKANLLKIILISGVYSILETLNVEVISKYSVPSG